jgi:hypothetical protein
VIITRISLRIWATILSMAILMVVVRIEEGRLARARQRVNDLALQAANTHAEGDSTRRVDVVSPRVGSLIGDSLRLVERLVVQRAQRQDRLDRALKRERLARYAMTVRAESLAAMAQGETEAESAGTLSSIRRASFRLRQAPYTIAAEVALPAAPDTGTLAVRVALDPLHVEARVSCAPADGSGIRAASVSATGPAWADVRFDRVEQSAELCASPALASERRRHRWLGGIPLVIGAGPVLTPRGTVSWGLYVGAGYSLNR